MSIDKVKSIKDRLKRVASERKAPFSTIMTQFLIERAIARIVIEPELVEHLVFKGGFVGLRMYGSPRYTTDLDAISYKQDTRIVIDKVRSALDRSLDDQVWFLYENQVDLVTQGEYGGIRLVYRFGLGKPPTDSRKAQVFHIDIGTGDPVTPMPLKKTMVAFLGKEEIIWLIYPIETILAEKLHPLVALGAENSRSKDVFDIAHHLSSASSELLKEAIAATFRYRETTIPSSFANFLKSLDKSKLKRGWNAATATVVDAPEFDSAITTIVEWFEKNNL